MLNYNNLLDKQLKALIEGNKKQAWSICERLEKINPNDFRHQFNRGWFLINQGKLQEGYQLLDAGRFINVYGSGKIKTDKPIWNGVKTLKNKVVILNLEGGLGDQVIMARFAKDIKDRGGKCIACCCKSLHSLISRIDGVYSCISAEDVEKIKHDYWIPSFSAVWLLGHDFTTLPNKPYISAQKSNIENWSKIITSDKLKVGIRWAGNPEFEHQQYRKFDASLMLDLVKIDGIQFYSLQKDNDIIELPEQINDLNHLLLSWEDTAAAIENLDLVITSCTSIAHAASAMGKPTWVIIPILPYHIWAFGDEHSPWYQDTTKVFRQVKFGNWDAPFKKIKNELIEFKKFHTVKQ